MEWIIVAALVGIAAFALLWYRRSDETVPEGSRIPLDALEEFLRESGIDLRSTKNPDPEILRPHIATDDTLVGAVEGRSGSKRAYLVLLGDRMVLGAATIGKMGAVVQSIPFHCVTQFEQGYDIGGTFRFDTDSAEFVITHVPRSKTRDFAGLVRNRLGDRPAET